MKKRPRTTAKEKRTILNAIKQVRKEGATLEQALKVSGLSSATYHHWSKTLNTESGKKPVGRPRKNKSQVTTTVVQDTLPAVSEQVTSSQFVVTFPNNVSVFTTRAEDAFALVRVSQTLN